MSELHLFPRDRVIRQPMTGGRTDAVAVTHLGMTKVYDCPQDLHAAVLVQCTPELEAAEAATARRRLRSYKARLRMTRAATLRRFRQDILAGVLISVVMGAAAGAFAFGLGL